MKLKMEELEAEGESKILMSKYSVMSNEQQNEPQWDNFGATSLAGSASFRLLHDSVILDSGINNHIIN